LVIVMGCNMNFDAFSKLKEELCKGVVRLKANPGGRRAQRASATMYASTNGGKKSLRQALSKIPWLKRKVLRETRPQTIQGVTLSHHAFRRAERLDGPMELLPLYVHHRLMVLRTK
jgi:hypothetical protein